MPRRFLPVFIILSILIFGADGSRIIMGLTGSVESMQGRGPVPAKYDFDALINQAMNFRTKFQNRNREPTMLKKKSRTLDIRPTLVYNIQYI